MSPPVVLFIMETNNLTGDKIMQEIWKDIKDYEGCYQVSNLGRVRSLDRVDRNGRKRNGVVKKPQDNGNGYKYVQLKKDANYKNFYIHRLVATHFIAPIEGKEYVNHKDGNKENNCFDNLEWCTESENMKHAYETGLNVPNDINELHKARDAHYESNAKVVVQKDVNGTVIKKHKNLKEAHNAINRKNTGFISRACNTGCIAYGYLWQYA